MNSLNKNNLIEFAEKDLIDLEGDSLSISLNWASIPKLYDPLLHILPFASSSFYLTKRSVSALSVQLLHV